MKSFNSIGRATKKRVLGLKFSTVAILSTSTFTGAIVVNEVHKSQQKKKNSIQLIPQESINNVKSAFHSNFDDILFSPMVFDIIPATKNDLKAKKRVEETTGKQRKKALLNTQDIRDYLINSSNAKKLALENKAIQAEKTEQIQSTPSFYGFSQEDLDYFSKYGLERNIVTASFRGNSFEWEDYIEKHLKYPTAAIENRVEGTVVVNFEVDKDGGISNAFISKSISKDLDDEALRLVRNFPDWNSKIVNDQSVHSIIEMPVTFDLE